MPLDLPLIVPAIRLDRDDGEESSRALERARQPWVAGFLLFGGEAEQVARLTQSLREEAGRPLLVAADMERGAGQQVQGLTQLPDFGLLGLAGTPGEAHAFGQVTAAEARSVGVDVVFAPCIDVRSEVDNPILGNRALGYDPWRVALLGSAFGWGVQSGGGLPVAKHFPGHGATREDSHDAVPVVQADARTLELRDLAPFAEALGSGACPAIMTAHVAYPALDATGAIATFSTPILERARHAAANSEHGLLVFTDALLMAGAAAEGGEAEAARRALAAGCDLLLYPEDPEALAAALENDAHAQRAAQQVEASSGLRAMLAEEGRPARGSATAAAEAVAERAVELAIDDVGDPACDVLVLVDDDGIESRGAVLAREAGRRGTAVLTLTVPREGEPQLPELPAAVRHVGLVVFASARAWKGTSGVSAACRRAVQAIQTRVEQAGGFAQTLWLTPRPVEPRDDHLPGTGPHLEAALVPRLLRPAPRSRT